jgi:hypothetical protein
MIDLNTLNQWRCIDPMVTKYYGNIGDGTEGAFIIPSPIDGTQLVVIASTGGGWDHVSVSRERRIPNQREMDHIFRLFFAADETAVQFFVPASDHVNNMPNCLHLWRCQEEAFPRPPQIMV